MPTFTIGISGASSSGKTTLSLILKEIFQRCNFKVVSIHEDDYFTIKAKCPLIHFRDETKGIDILGIDCDSWDSVEVDRLVRAIAAVKLTGDTMGDTSEASNLSVFPENKADLQAHQDLITAMQVRVKGWLETYNEIAGHPQSSPEQGGLNIASASTDSNLYNWRKWIKPTICLVDGFLLYSDPAIPALLNANTEAAPHRPQFATRTSSLPVNENLTPPGHMANDSTSSGATSTNGERSTIPIGFEVPQERASDYNPDRKFPSANPNITTKDNKLRLNEYIDLKLLIPVTKATAKARRFARTVYMDPPNGTRKPNENWKTEGYFNDVVWAHYAKEHDWLFAGNVEKIPVPARLKHKGDVRMPFFQDADIETLVRWAVETILLEMGRKISKVSGENVHRLREHANARSGRVDMSIPPPLFVSRIENVVDDVGSTADASDLTTINEEDEEERVEAGAKVGQVATRKGARISFFGRSTDRVKATLAGWKDKRLAKKTERAQKRREEEESDVQGNSSRTGLWNRTILGTPLTPMINAWRNRGSGNGFDGGPVELIQSKTPVDLDA